MSELRFEQNWSPLEAPVIKASLPSNDLAFVFGGTTCGIPLVILLIKLHEFSPRKKKYKTCKKQ
jgi:hypothetical protein